MNQMTMTFQQHTVRKHVPNRKAIRIINALTKEGLSDIKIAEITGITRQSVLAIRNGGDVRRSTYAKLMKAKLTTRKESRSVITKKTLSEQRRQATADALNWLNRRGWDDRRIAKRIYLARNGKQTENIANIRNGAVMRERVFERLMSLVEEVKGNRPEMIANCKVTLSLWQRFKQWIASFYAPVR